MAAAMPYFLYPIVILGAILLLLGVVALLARIKGGKYLRPIVGALAKVPLFRRLMTKASAAALERQNPALANAVKKLEKVQGTRDPLQAQRALSRLTPEERDAYFEALGEQGALQSGATNRAERRRLEKMQQPTRRSSAGKSGSGKSGSGKRKRRSS
jgi:hypothetical protein